MNIDVRRRLFVAAAVLGVVAVLAAAFFIALGVRGVVAGPDSAPLAQAPNPGHSWSEIGDLPGTMWHSNNDGAGSGLDADSLDGLNSDEIQDADDYVSSAGALSRLGFSTTPVDSAGVLGYTSITVGVDGLPVISYLDATNYDLKVAHCGNAACTSATTTTVDSAGSVGLKSSITVGADGLPVVSYHDSTNQDLKVAHCGNAACTAGNTITTVDSAGTSLGSHGTSITLGADGLPIISYGLWPNGGLRVAHCSDPACTSASITTVDSAVWVGDMSSITVGADGLPIISYYYYPGVGLRVAHCGNAACTAGNTITTVHSGSVGYFTSITVGTDGLAVVSYWDIANEYLKVAHCSDPACTAATISTVDSAGNVGEYTSITVGADGLPIVAYQEADGDLKVAHCADPACTSASTTAVDGSGVTAAQSYTTSITVGADGLPVISYRDATSGDLKVTHCSNRFCVPYHRPR